MDKQKKQSVIPIYAVGLVWLSRAISGNLSSFGQIIKTARESQTGKRNKG